MFIKICWRASWNKGGNYQVASLNRKLNNEKGLLTCLTRPFYFLLNQILAREKKTEKVEERESTHRVKRVWASEDWKTSFSPKLIGKDGYENIPELGELAGGPRNRRILRSTPPKISWWSQETREQSEDWQNRLYNTVQRRSWVWKVKKVRKAERGSLQDGGSCVQWEGREMSPCTWEITKGKLIPIIYCFKN